MSEIADFIKTVAKIQNDAVLSGVTAERNFGESALKLKAIEKRLALLFLGAEEALLLLHDGFAEEAALRLQRALHEARS